MTNLEVASSAPSVGTYLDDIDIEGLFRRRVTRSRLHGYEDALRAAGLEPSEDLVAEGDWTPLLPVELIVRDSCGSRRIPRIKERH